MPNKEHGQGSTTPDKPYNNKTKVFNNAADDWRESKEARCHKPLCSPPCQANSNSQGQCDWPAVHEMLRDVRVFDFRPKADSRLVGAASNAFSQFAPGNEKTIGAYEAVSNYYSIPGKIWAKSSAPVPPHGFPAVRPAQDLIFNQGKGASKHDIFLGRDACAVTNAPTGNLNHRPTSSTFVDRLSWPRNIISPRDTLSVGEVYYWRVDAIGGPHGVVKGETWCFKVSNSAQNTLEVPWNMVTGLHACAKDGPDSCGTPPISTEAPPTSNPTETPPDPTSSCGTALAIKKKCTGGVIKTLSNSAANADDCKKLCETRLGAGNQCCVFFSKNSKCRLHSGAFKGPSKGNKQLYAAICTGSTTESPAPPTEAPITTQAPGEASCGTSLQQKKTCSGGNVNILSNSAADASTCKSLCEGNLAAGDQCCVFFAKQSKCSLRSGSFKGPSRANKQFYAAACVGIASTVPPTEPAPGGTSCGATLKRGKVCSGGNINILSESAANADACKALCETNAASKGCCTFYSKTSFCRHHVGDYQFGSGNKKFYSATCQST